MNLTKMSLVAAATVASLGTVSFADAKISGKADFRFKSFNEFSRDRIDVNVKSHSMDKMGMLHFKVRYDKGALSVNKLYAKYNFGNMISVGMGPKIGAPGKLSFSTNAGAYVTAKAMGHKINVGMFNTGGKSKTLIAASGKAGMAGYAVDYQMGDAKQYAALLAHANVGSMKFGVGYAMNMMEGADNTMMGASFNMKMGAMGVGAGATMSGMTGGPIVEKSSTTGLPAELGSYAGSQAAGVLGLYANVGMKVMGLKVGAYGSMSGKIIEGQVSVAKKLNAQTGAKFLTTYNMGGSEPMLTTELRLATKF